MTTDTVEDVLSRRAHWQRVLVLLGVGLAIGATSGFAAAFQQVRNPATSRPTRADAVVVFYGGEERAPAAVELMETGVADALVLNHGLANGRLTEPYFPPCDDPTLDYEVICIAASPSDTLGEARAFSDLAEQRGWDSLIAFTTDFHSARARFHLERCFKGTVDSQIVDAQRNTGDVRESAKLLVAWTTRPDC